MDLNKLKEIFSDCDFCEEKIIIKNRLHDTVQFIKENYTFDILQEIIAVHQENNEIELLYHFYSTIDEEDLWISIFVENEAESIIDIYESAVAEENEIYDLFGVKFIGNKNLKRLYMPEDWQGFPLRKDYVQDDTRLCWNDDNNA